MPQTVAAQNLSFDSLNPLTDLSLYYALGGDSATTPPASLFTRLPQRDAQSNLRGSLCGQFDPATDVADILSSYLDETMTSLSVFPRSVVGALPGYILCRAQPGMCQLLQHYVVRAEHNWESAIRSCESDVSNAVSNGPSYRDWTQVSKVQSWQQQAEIGSTASHAKDSVDSSNGCVIWVGGGTAGCVDHEPIWLTKDTVRAGWCLIQNHAVNCNVSGNSGDSSNNALLRRTWPDANTAVEWISEVVGDQKIQVGGKPASISGTGLLPKIEDESSTLISLLRATVYSGNQPSQADLDQLGAVQVRVTSEIIHALRDLPDREYLIGRLSNEIALLRVVNKAFLGRRLLLSGMMEPNIQAVGIATEPLLEKVDLLEREIERAVYEMQLSRRLISETASQILSAHQLLMSPKPPVRQLSENYLP